MVYIYPAIFKKEDDGIIVTFPDIEGCFTDGADMSEAFINAEDALNLMLWDMEESKRKISPPTSVEDIVIPDGAVIGMVKADTLAYKRSVDTKAVRKNVSIPNWLNTLAMEKNINFSNVLQNALMENLGIQRRI